MVDNFLNYNSNIESDLQTTAYSFPVDHKDTCLQLKGWVKPQNRNRPPILFVHDFGQSHEDYEAVARQLATNGFNTYVYDLRGHGDASILHPVHARIKTHARDLLQIFAWVRHKEQRCPPVLIGVGVGCTIASEFVQRHPDMSQELIFCAPILQLKKKRSRIQQFLLDLLAEVRPKQSVPHAFCPVLLQRPSVEDSKAQPKINAGFAMELLHLIPRTTSRITQRRKPTLVLCPGQDELTHYDQILRFAQSENYPQLTAYDLSDASRHIFEHQPETAVKLVQNWLNTAGRRFQTENQVKVSPETSIMDTQQTSA